MNAVRKVAIAIACCALCCAFAASTQAATIPAPMAHFSSVQIDQGRVIWFQRNDRWSESKRGYGKRKPGVGAIYARTLAGGRPQRVYLPPKGSRIVAFKAAHGRVAIGLATIAKDNRGPSSIVDLTPSETVPWAATTVLKDPFTVDADSCGSRVSLVGIAANSDLIALRTRLEPRGKDCVLAREISQSASVARDGTVTEQKARTSGWSITQSWDLVPLVVPAGDQLLQLTSQFSGEYTPLSLWNPATGDYAAIRTEGINFSRVEQFGANGLAFPAQSSWDSAFIVPDVSHFDDVSRLAISRNGDGYAEVIVFRKSADAASKHSSGKGIVVPPAVPARPSGFTWFHACGSRILRIKSAHTRHHRPIWSLASVDPEGKPTVKLKTTLPAGTGFDACDANEAVFHRWHKDHTARQWSVRLAP